ncbi:hypothetical protein GCM10023321_50090 [Pseudonocardia eucalypti]|uniref:Uncharacterized protein n=1 Tax=Pseudonocardia eucalypti TaxID=648755 RepID=A0ABP9QKB4_9PSEU
MSAGTHAEGVEMKFNNRAFLELLNFPVVAPTTGQDLSTLLFGSDATPVAV